MESIDLEQHYPEPSQKEFRTSLLAAIANGDVTYMQRTALKTAQWQVVVVAVEAILVVIAATVLVSSL